MPSSSTHDQFNKRSKMVSAISQITTRVGRDVNHLSGALTMDVDNPISHGCALAKGVESVPCNSTAPMFRMKIILELAPHNFNQ